MILSTELFFSKNLFVVHIVYRNVKASAILINLKENSMCYVTYKILIDVEFKQNDINSLSLREYIHIIM